MTPDHYDQSCLASPDAELVPAVPRPPDPDEAVPGAYGQRARLYRVTRHRVDKPSEAGQTVILRLSS